MTRRASNLKSLTRGHIRASWNKWNLFNLYKKHIYASDYRTLYQQKWKGKTETRAYHGEQLTERAWQNIFEPKLESFAQLDASKHASIPDTPLTLQTYAPLERRLDTAIFRAMFASSVREARQQILHSPVLVNGIRIKHPGYVLKAGDVFSVDPEKVLTSLGRKKPGLKKALNIDNTQIAKFNDYIERAKANPKKIWDEKQQAKKADFLNNETDRKKIQSKNNDIFDKISKQVKQINRETVLTDILSNGIKVNGSKSASPHLTLKWNPKEVEMANDIFKIWFQEVAKQDLTKFKQMKQVDLEAHSKSIVKPNKDKLLKKDADTYSTIRKQLSILNLSRATTVREELSSKLNSENKYTPTEYNPRWIDGLQRHQSINVNEALENEKKYRSRMNLPWQKNHFYGRKDLSKPYFTPWEPRPFIGPFSIYPHHIEVSFKTCHAVYLRDPVARPGTSEVISPVPVSLHNLAYMFYQRKRL